ncbi:MAG: hypothetical protein R3C44_14565 [Chloroflexota bacterium]
MIQTARVYWPQIKGRVTLNYSWPGVISKSSVIHIAASEAGSWAQQPNGTATATRVAAAADVFVMAVAPKPDRVEFVLKVDWKGPLDVITDITVMDPPTVYVKQQAAG